MPKESGYLMTPEKDNAPPYKGIVLDPDGADVTTAYGSSENHAFDQAVVRMLYETNKTATPEFLGRYEEVMGQVDDSEYYKRVFGKPVIISPDNETSLCIENFKVQHVTILDKGVSEHSHQEGEWYLIPEDSGPGILDLDGTGHILSPGNFYYIPSGLKHSLRPLTDKELKLIVSKFSRKALNEFRDGMHIYVPWLLETE